MSLHPSPHPKERRLSRREFLRRSASGAVAVSGAGALLAACRERPPSAGPGGTAEVPLARPDRPVELPLSDRNPGIADGLSPEAGPLRIFNWNDYIYKKVLKRFEAEFGVEIEYTQFTGMSEAIAKVQNETVQFDLFFPTIDHLRDLVLAGRIMPLNHSYLPNVRANAWPSLQDPFYDRGSRYSVPYLTWKTGIGYRRDMVDVDLAGLPMPLDVFWDPAYRGLTGVLDEYRDTMGMVLIRNGSDPNTEDPAAVERAGRDLLAMIDATNVKVAVGDYQALAEGVHALRLSWSGNMNYARYYLPKGTPVDVLGFYYPPQGGWLVNNDLIVVSSKARNPVLAHAFINFLYDRTNALDNFSYEGYQPPLTGVSLEEFRKAGYIPRNLETTLVQESDFAASSYLLELPPEVDQLYQDAWAAFKAGV
jgi:spermidine/putrescine transport system substrate-binding protein